MERLVFWHRWLPTNDLDDAALQRSAQWVRAARDWLENQSAEVVFQVGATLVAVLDVTEAAQAVDVALDMLAAQDGEHGTGLELAIAVTSGEVASTEANGPLLGEPFERAQSLVAAVEGGSLVLDVGAQQLVASDYLFSHSVTSRDGIDGELIDRQHPRRRDCRTALVHLRQPRLRPASAAQYAALKQLAGGQGRHRVALIGPHGVGASQWIRSLAEQLSPPAWLNAIPVAGSLTPLGALGYALRRLQRGERPVEYWLDLSEERDAACSQAFAAMREGRAMSRRAAVGALRHFLLRVARKSDDRAWLSLNPVSQLDPATIRVVAEATREGAPDSLLFLRLLPGQKPPALFGRGHPPTEIRMPALSPRDGQAAAMALLGEGADPDIARRAAAIGGPTMLGVVEAVRSMVSSGEIIHTNDGFRWRRGPGGRGNPVQMEALLEQRLEQLEAAPRRMLETLITVPDAAEGQVVEEVARMDGLSEAARGYALDLLVEEGFISSTPGGFDISQVVRNVVTLAMPSARRSELYRFVGDVLHEAGAAEADFGRAMLGHYYAHGGRPTEAVRLFMETAQLAGRLGWVRTAVRLAAAAVQTDPSTRTREVAAQLTRSLTREVQAPAATKPRPNGSTPSTPGFGASEPPSRPDLAGVPDAPGAVGEAAVQRALDALVAGDVEGVERSIELATASGLNGGAVERLKALSLLTRGDHHGALRLLKKAKAEAEGRPREQARSTLAEALVWLEADQVPMALRAALHALATSRGSADKHGERAALRTLSTCYRRLGREADAQALEAAS